MSYVPIPALSIALNVAGNGLYKLAFPIFSAASIAAVAFVAGIGLMSLK